MDLWPCLIFLFNLNSILFQPWNPAEILPWVYGSQLFRFLNYFTSNPAAHRRESSSLCHGLHLIWVKCKFWLYLYLNIYVENTVSSIQICLHTTLVETFSEWCTDAPQTYGVQSFMSLCSCSRWLSTFSLLPYVHKDALQGGLCLVSYLFFSMCIWHCNTWFIIDFQTVHYEVQRVFVIVSRDSQSVLVRICIFYWDTSVTYMRSNLVSSLENGIPSAYSHHWRWI